MANIISYDSFSLIQDPNNNNNHNSNIPIPISIPIPIPTKRKRSLPGAPDPDSEVIALSPKSLTATNRFVCEVCKKGFQRDQNLQLHRRGHNLPWKLKRSDKDSIIKKKVYVCPENSCVHHHPSRALGDLTGIKKHYSRKHGEKKWMCLKCSKKYAVQSDWKAHGKICGTKEYKCYCGTIFSRKDSFNTHKAFCEALTILPPANLNYRADGMNLRPAGTYGSLIVSGGQEELLEQFKLPTDYHGIGNYCHGLIDNSIHNYWSGSLALPQPPALMFPGLKEEGDCRGFSSNTLPAAENCYYGNEQVVTHNNGQVTVQMGSSSTTTTTTHDDHQNNNISSIFCNSNINGGDHEQENMNLLRGNKDVRMMTSKGNYKIINGGGHADEFVLGGDDHPGNSNPFHAMIREGVVDRSTTRDFLGTGGWSTFDMAKISNMTSGHCSSTGSL